MQRILSRTRIPLGGAVAGDEICDVLGMITGFHSAVVDVPDLEAATADYARMLGHAPIRLESDSGRGSRSALFAVANTALELRQWRQPREGARLGQSGIRLVCESEDPGPTLAQAGIALASSTACESISQTGLAPRCFTLHEIERTASRGIPVELVCAESLALAPGHVDDAGGVAPEAQINALDHVVVMSPAPDATRDFYGDGLGLRLALDKSFEKRGVRLLFFRVGGVTIEIGARMEAEPQPAREDRFGGLAWQTPAIDATQARLAADGFDVSEVRTGNKPGTRVCTVRDPVYGVPTLLIEPVKYE